MPNPKDGNVTREEFDEALNELVSAMSTDELLATSGVYEALSEELNNEAIERAIERALENRGGR